MRKQFSRNLTLVTIFEYLIFLAKQISDDFESVATGISIVTIYGGKRYEDQENSIRQGCDVLVATPGRLKDILEKKKVSLAQVKHVILDEVDRMLDMGFIDDVEQILGHIFKGGLFSIIAESKLS